MVAPLTIGNVALPTNLLLAPMAGYCDVAFRLIARSFGGLGLACTDLLSPEGVLRETKHTMSLVKTRPEDWPLAMQLYGGDAERLCEAARWAVDHGAFVVDLNMGCPVDKILKQDGGSALLCDPGRTLRIVERLRKVVRTVPLTCKLRLGWDDSRLVAPELARGLEEIGVDAVTIHGRTTEMKFSGQVRLDGIAHVVAAVRRIPVIGNGDVRTPVDAKRMLDVTGCAGVMIGRGALSAPWIFRDTWSYLTTGATPQPPTLEDKCRVIREHFQNAVEYRGEHAAIHEIRQRISWYGKTMPPCKEFKEQVRTINSRDDLERAIEQFLAVRASGHEPEARGDSERQ